MKSKRISLISVLSLVIIIATVFMVSCGTPAPSQTTTNTTTPVAAAKNLDIGCIFTLSGTGSMGEDNLRIGAVACADWINKQGGITVKGQKYNLNLIVEDSQGNVTGTVAAINRLVEGKGVKYIVGLMAADQVEAAGQITEPAKVLRALTGGVTGTWKQYEFETGIGGAYCLPGLLAQLKADNPSIKTLSMMYPDTAGNRRWADLSKAAAEKVGLTVSQEFYPNDTQDYYAVMSKVLGAKPDVIDGGTMDPLRGGSIIKTARELGYKGPIFSFSGADAYNILKTCGTTYGDNFYNTSLDIQNPPTEAMKELIKIWSTLKTTPFMTDTCMGWDGTWTLTQAIQAAQSLDPTDVVATWEKMTKIESLYGIGKMGGLVTNKGFNHTVARPFPICKLEAGKVRVVKMALPDLP